VVLRLRSLAAWLLIAEGAVLGCLSFWASVLLSWAPDEDQISTSWDGDRAHLQAGAAGAVLVVLAVVSAAAGSARLLNTTGGPVSVTVAHAAGALAVLVYGLPWLAAVLTVAACAWTGVMGRDDRLLREAH
jgi:hypothetical protein